MRAATLNAGGDAPGCRLNVSLFGFISQPPYFGANQNHYAIDQFGERRMFLVIEFCAFNGEEQSRAYRIVVKMTVFVVEIPRLPHGDLLNFFLDVFVSHAPIVTKAGKG